MARLDVGEVEDAGLRGELGVEHDLEPAGRRARRPARAWRPPRARRRPRRPPRAGACAATCGSARGPTGSRRAGAAAPRSRASPTGRRRPARARPGRGRAAPASAAAVERRDRRAVGRPEPPDRVVGRVEPREDRERVAHRAARARPGSGTGGLGRRRAQRGGSPAGRSGSGRDGSIGRADQRLGRDDLQAVSRDRDPSGVAPPRRARRATGPPAQLVVRRCDGLRRG